MADVNTPTRQPATMSLRRPHGVDGIYQRAKAAATAETQSTIVDETMIIFAFHRVFDAGCVFT